MSERGTRVLVATEADVLIADPGDRTLRPGAGLDGRFPTCLAADPNVAGRAWCGTRDGGVFRTTDGGRSWHACGLDGKHVMSITADPVRPGELWVGTEPSAVWHGGDGGASWEATRALDDLPSAPDWAFPPRPETHHVRWIACHPLEWGRLWVAVEAGALVSTTDGGRSWQDRVAGGPWDTHELAVHRDAPGHLRIAAGDGYFESPDGGRSWTRPGDGLGAPYLRSVAVDPGDPGVVLVSGASRPRSAYVAGRSDGVLHRRAGSGSWIRVLDGWPDPPTTIAPLLRPGHAAGELWAADERGIHHSTDGGAAWHRIASYPSTPRHLRGFDVQAGSDG